MSEVIKIMKRCKIGTRNYDEANDLHAECYGAIGKLLQENKALRADAERYRRLGFLVAAGDWSVGQHETIDSYGVTDDTYMDDKNMMDEWLDRPDVVEEAAGWKKAFEKKTGE